MPDYTAYMAAAGISNRQMIEALRPRFPLYGKPTQTMVTNPEKYGVRLLPEAEAALAERWGFHPGLTLPKKKPKRRKDHRLAVRLDADLYRRVKLLMLRREIPTAQAFLEQVLTDYLSREEAVT